MKVITLSGSLRENVGKNDAKRLRSQNMVPCVLYGGKEQVHFALDEKYFQKLLFTPEVCFVEIHINDKTYRAIIQDVQFHPVTDRVIHADFLELTEKPITMSIPIRVQGNSPGVMRGGKLVLSSRRVPVRALPDNMPEHVVIDISTLDIGDKIKVKDIQSETFKILLDAEAFLVKVDRTRKVEDVAENQQS